MLVIQVKLTAQDLSVGTSTTHDDNVFDIYSPLSDQITNLQIDASKDWDLEQTSLGLTYNGSMLLFRDLTTRNYHVHVLSFNVDHHFERDEDTDAPDEDSSDSEQDSAAVRQAASKAALSSGHSDSLDNFLTASLTGGSQFDREEFSQYDNAIISGTVTFRQPLELRASVRPSYTISYHNYPNLSGITNLQNIFALQLGTNIIPGGWIVLTPSYAIKNYPSSTTITYTVEIPGGGNGNGHGKGNSGSGAGSGTRTRNFNLATPSVKQFSATLLWKQKVIAGTEIVAHYTRFGNPSTEARIIPQQLLGGLEERGIIGQFTSENEIFDDHFAYSGNEVGLKFQHSLPYAFSMAVNGQFNYKRYTVPAMDLADSLVLADNRIDRRSEVVISLSKSFSVGDGKQLKPEVEYHYLRNNSNAPYYTFDKNVFMAGLEFAF
ncbi:MAG: hypothetical protein HYR76_05720 [Ignavibacteria bacterium]|nr:hypothetical protein [Ignavibacteria bacterium]MBI3764955.1 hypothetical protein [Ignavibacteriales bacterium]